MGRHALLPQGRRRAEHRAAELVRHGGVDGRAVAGPVHAAGAPREESGGQRGGFLRGRGELRGVFGGLGPARGGRAGGGGVGWFCVPGASGPAGGGAGVDWGRRGARRRGDGTGGGGGDESGGGLGGECERGGGRGGIG